MLSPLSINQMKTLIVFIGFLLVFVVLQGCIDSMHTKPVSSAVLTDKFVTYSAHVKDTFYISVQLPLAYSKNSKQHFGVIYLTDANFYFPMLGPILHQYEKGGLLPPLILVGISYKSMESMNALRVRDYLYPEEIPSDEMKAPGGGLNYYHFITRELLPKIDNHYRTQKAKSMLLGHSFGGYFSLFALQRQLTEKRKDFSSFVSASPTLWYNQNYLFRLPRQLKTTPQLNKLNLYLSAGQLETPIEWTIHPVQKLSKQLSAYHLPGLKLSTVIYNHLDHMDAGLVSFLQGIEATHSAANP